MCWILVSPILLGYILSHYDGRQYTITICNNYKTTEDENKPQYSNPSVYLPPLPEDNIYAPLMGQELYKDKPIFTDNYQLGCLSPYGTVLGHKPKEDSFPYGDSYRPLVWDEKD